MVQSAIDAAEAQAGPMQLQNKMERVPNIFAVVCDPSGERVYPWGTVRIDDIRLSDFRRLQACLFENGTL